MLERGYRFINPRKSSGISFQSVKFNLYRVVSSFGEGMDDINKRLITTIDLIEEYSQTKYNILELRDRLNRQKRRSIEPIMHTGIHSNIWLYASPKL